MLEETSYNHMNVQTYGIQEMAGQSTRKWMGLKKWQVSPAVGLKLSVEFHSLFFTWTGIQIFFADVESVYYIIIIADAESY